MVQRLFSFLKRPTSRNVIINTAGNYLGVFFSAFFVYLLVRVMDPAEYGVLSVLFGISYVLANILDFGTTATMYSYLPPLVQSGNKNMYRLIKSMFFYQSVFSAIVITVLLLTFPYLDRVFFKTGAPLWELYITAFSVLCFIWVNFISNCLFAAKRVIQINWWSLVSNIVKTSVILVLWMTGTISAGWVIVTFGIVGPAVFFLLAYLDKEHHVKHVLNATISREDFRFNFTFTYFVASQFFNLGTRMDLFLMSHFRPKAEVGFYGLAQKIILTIISTVISITQVISPHFSNITSKKDFFKNIKSGFLYMLIPTVLFLLLAITPDWIFVLVFGTKFLPTAQVSRWLAWPFVLYPFMSLAHLFLLYTAKKPMYILYVNIVLFTIVSVGCYLFIPSYGIIAAIWSLGVAFFFSGLVLAALSVHEYGKLSA